MPSTRLTQQQNIDCLPTVRVVIQFDDPFAGLKGHDYIKARNLDRQVQRVQTSAQPQSPAVEVCA